MFNKKYNKLFAAVLMPVAFILAWTLSVIIVVLGTILASKDHTFILDVYYQNKYYFLIMYLFTSLFLVFFGVWFANKFYNK